MNDNTTYLNSIFISTKYVKFSATALDAPHYYQFSGYCSEHGYFEFSYQNNKPVSFNLLLRVIVEYYKKYFGITKNPTTIILCSLNSSFLLVHLKNFLTIQSKFYLIDKSYVTASKPLKIKINDKNNNPVPFKLYLFDPVLLMPGKSTLEDLASSVGLEYTSLPPEYFFDLDSLAKNDFDLLIKYCSNETNIVLNYFLRYFNIYQEYLSKSEVPPTIGSFCEKLFLEHAKEQNIDVDFFFGYETHNINYLTKEDFEFVSYDTKILNEFSLCFEYLSRESFHGGRNECFFCGITPTDTWSDWDIIAAYTTILAMLSPLDYRNSYECADPSQYQPEIPGFAKVIFQFPDHTCYPCLPVRTENGLLFPLQGASYVTSPEIYLALQLGASIQIQTGRIFPYASNNLFPCLKFIQNVQQKRNSFPKQSLENLFWKQIGNSLFGKISQGIGMKRKFDSRRGETNQIHRSKITNSYFASYITGYIRALMAEIMNKIPQNKQIISVTTDGFITNATDDEVFQACNGRLSWFFSRYRDIVSGCNNILDKKHVANQLVSWKTRGVATITNEKDDEKIILAKSGIQTPYTTKHEQNNWMLDLYFNRNKNSRYLQTTTTPISHIIKNGGKKISYIFRHNLVNMDYDFKRFPDYVYEDNYENKSLLCFTTKPFLNSENYTLHAKIFKNYQKSNYNCLKTIDDFNSWKNYYMTVENRGDVQNHERVKRNGKSDVNLAIKEFTTAYARQFLNLKKSMKYPELTSWLNDNGFKCNITQIKNYAKTSRKYYNNRVPKTKETLRFVDLIKTKFPEFNEHDYFVR